VLHGQVRRVGRVVVAFGLAAVLLWLFARVAGPRRLAAELAGADPRYLVAATAAALAALAVRSEALRLVVSVAVDDGRTRGRRFRLAFLAGEFTKQVLPMGHASGPAITAYAVASVVGTDYEETLATVTVADLLNLIASLVLAAVGLAAVVATGGSHLPGLSVFAAALVAATLAVTVVLASVTVRRRTFVAVVRRLARVCDRLVGRAFPRLGRAVAPAAVDRTLQSYFRTFDAVAAERLRVVAAAALALVGWLLFATPLYLAGLALDVTVPVTLAFFLVPVAGLATWLPLPGGTGGVKVAVAGGLVAVAGVGVGTAAAVAVAYRLSAYWAVVAVDGVAALSLLVGRRASRVDDEDAPPVP
jgi:uncharacterized protein (TIRG00374 family)